MNARSKGCEEEVSGDTVSQVHINLPHAWYQQQPMIEDPPLRSILSILQCGRAIAALAVVGFHTRLGVEAFAGKMPAALSSPLSYGYLGVDFFFVLSGFIIFRTNSRQKADRRWLAQFASGRATRIFIPYLPVALSMALLYLAAPGLGGAQRDWDWFTTVTLFPGAGTSALSVAWTLCHELAFYAVFAAALLAGRPILGVAAWVVAGVALSMVLGGDVAFLSMINLEFLFGMIAAKATIGRAAEPYLYVLGAALCFLGVRLGDPRPDDMMRVLFGAGAALILLPLVAAEERGPINGPRVLVLLGNASYALYLIHNPVISLIVRLSPPNWAIAALLCLVVTILAALAYHRLFEMPAIGLVRRRVAPGRSGQATS